jgi:hypothetical protein
MCISSKPAVRNNPIIFCFSLCLGDEPALSLPKGGANILFSALLSFRQQNLNPASASVIVQSGGAQRAGMFVAL